MCDDNVLKAHLNMCMIIPFLEHSRESIWDWDSKQWVEKPLPDEDSDEKILYGDEYPKTEEEKQKMLERIAQKFEKMKKRLEERRKKSDNS